MADEARGPCYTAEMSSPKSRRKRKPKITVRGYEPDDVDAMSEIMREPSVVLGTLQLPYRSNAWRRERWNKPDESRHTLVAELDGDIVGMASLVVSERPRSRHVGGIGMAVAERARRKGVGRKLLSELLNMAFSWIGLLRVELSVFVDNEAAVTLYRKAGFQIEGIGRADCLRDGKLVDTFRMVKMADRLPWDRVTAEDVAQKLPPMLPPGPDAKKNGDKRKKKKKGSGWDVN